MTDAINPDHYKRLPAEAIEIIESAIENAPSNQDAYLHGQVIKYVLRCWNKNGIEDLKKAKWYLDRLIDSLDEREKQKADDLQSLKDHPFGKPKSVSKAEAPMSTGEATGEVTGEVKPPDSWRFLERGEVIRKGDQGFEKGLFHAIDSLIGMELQDHWMPVIRRNRFEVGEKVVHIDDRESIPYEIDEYIRSKDAYVVKYKDGHYMYHWSKLAPYIEDAK